MSETDILSTLSKARSNRQAQQRLLGLLGEKIERRRGEMAQSLIELPASQRTPIINRAVSGYRNQIKRETAETRLAHVREAARHAEQARSVSGHYRSPVQMLVRRTIGSERRSRILQQIATSGPTELASLADLAAATKDEELAAALCSRVADLPHGKRPFSGAELADVLVGERYRTVTLALMEIDRLAEEAAQEDSGFQTGRRNSQRALGIALMKRAENELGTEMMSNESGDEETES